MSAFTKDNLKFIFADSLLEIIKKMTGFPLDILSYEDDSNFDEITGVMNLNGKNHGLLLISADENTIRIICSFMTGIKKEEITKNDIEDTLCELVNMTAGSAKLRLSKLDFVFNLTSPFLFKGQNMHITGNNRVHIVSVVLGNEEIKIKIKIVY
ncbi:MAG: chemotaxis protein CheX [Treponema sp.]|nr:chemotaxis protein CheX [Treponema sp.]